MCACQMYSRVVHCGAVQAELCVPGPRRFRCLLLELPHQQSQSLLLPLSLRQRNPPMKYLVHTMASSCIQHWVNMPRNVNPTLCLLSTGLVLLREGRQEEVMQNIAYLHRINNLLTVHCIPIAGRPVQRDADVKVLTACTGRAVTTVNNGF